MIVIFDDDATIHMPTLTAYGTIWNWLSVRVVIAVRIKPPPIHDLGRVKSVSYNLGRSFIDYTLGEVKKGDHNLGGKVE